jgi:hypothetical protein
MTQEDAKNFSEHISEEQKELEAKHKIDIKNVLRFSFGRKHKKENEIVEEPGGKLRLSSALICIMLERLTSWRARGLVLSGRWQVPVIVGRQNISMSSSFICGRW